MRISSFWRLGLTFLVLVLAILIGVSWFISANVSPDAAKVARHALWLAQIAVLIVTSVVFLIFSLVFSSRMKRVKHFAQRAAAGDFTPLPRPAVHDEVADLGDAVGGMVAQLGQSIRTLTDERNRSWIFRSVGYGHAYGWWKEFISTLRMYGYDYVLSIEHEDSLMSPDEGLSKASAFLNAIVIKDRPTAAWWV